MSRSPRLVSRECLLREGADCPQLLGEGRVEILLEKRSISQADDGGQRRSVGMTMRFDVSHEGSVTTPTYGALVERSVVKNRGGKNISTSGSETTGAAQSKK